MKSDFKVTDTPMRGADNWYAGQAKEAAKEMLKRANGGLPPNLHMYNRGVLVRIIKEQHDELVRLRAQ